MRKPSLLLSVALVTSIAAAAWFHSELRVERMRNAELTAQLAAASRRAVEPAAQSSADEAVRSTVNTAPTPAVPSSETRVVHGRQEEWEEYQRRLLKDPKYRAARVEERRLQLSARRDDAIRLLGFTAAEADAVITSWVDREMRWSEQPTPTVDMSAEGLQRLKEQNEARESEYQDQLRKLVGEEKRARWQGYMESLGSRTRVDQLRIQLTGADALRDDQVEPLVAAIHSERARMQQELGEFRDSLLWEGDTRDSSRQYQDRKIELMKAVNERTHSSAVGILSRAQLARLDELMRYELERELALQRLARAATKVERANVN